MTRHNHGRRHRLSEEPAIVDLSFSIESRYRPFHLVSPGFLAASVDEVGRSGRLQLAEASPPAPYAAVEVDVQDAGDAVVVAGIATATDEHVLARYDRRRQRLGIEVRRDGRARTARSRKVRLPRAFRLAFVLCENAVTVLVDKGDGWAARLTERRRVAAAFDLRRPETLARFRYAWGAASGTAILGTVTAGVFGMAGLRDLHLVQHSDGRPYTRDGKAYLTATCSGMGFFPQGHWGVFTLDLGSPRELTQVAHLFFRRDGLLLGDHSGQVVRDDEHGRWLVATSSWGDFAHSGVHVRHTSTSVDILSGVHVLSTEPTRLPTSLSTWDPSMTRIDGRWYVAYVASRSQKPFDFHPALAVGPEGANWTQDLRPVGEASDLHQCEGPVISRLEGRWWVLASDGARRRYPVFTLGMRRVGWLDAPYPTNIPHPQVLPLDDGSHLLVTFDGTPFAKPVLGYGTHGDVVVMRSATGP